MYECLNLLYCQCGAVSINVVDIIRLSYYLYSLCYFNGWVIVSLTKNTEYNLLLYRSGQLYISFSHPFLFKISFKTSTRCRHNASLFFVHHLRRWPNLVPTLGERFVSARFRRPVSLTRVCAPYFSCCNPKKITVQ